MEGLGFQHPPCSEPSIRLLARDVHYDVAQREEQTRGQGFSEEVREIVCAAHEGHRELERLQLFAYKEVTTVDMLRPRVVLRVVGQVDGRFFSRCTAVAPSAPSPSSCRRARK
eukprot:4056280-Pleurochrysis_carterae.AAC.1